MVTRPISFKINPWKSATNDELITINNKKPELLLNFYATRHIDIDVILYLSKCIQKHTYWTAE
jgi:hypothetical protein